LVFALFAGRLFQLQLIEGEDRAPLGRTRCARASRPRGEIVDREGAIATTRLAFGLRSCPGPRGRRRTFAASAIARRDPPARDGAGGRGGAASSRCVWPTT
jgi:hypothetical protein